MLEVHVQVAKHPRELRENFVELTRMFCFIAGVVFRFLILLVLRDANPISHHWEQCQVIDWLLGNVAPRVEDELRCKYKRKSKELLFYLTAHTALIIAQTLTVQKDTFGVITELKHLIPHPDATRTIAHRYSNLECLHFSYNLTRQEGFSGVERTTHRNDSNLLPSLHLIKHSHCFWTYL